MNSTKPKPLCLRGSNGDESNAEERIGETNRGILVQVFQGTTRHSR